MVAMSIKKIGSNFLEGSTVIVFVNYLNVYIAHNYIINKIKKEKDDKGYEINFCEGETLQ
jgi:hypothetical protein